jgi:hypothetical protein
MSQFRVAKLRKCLGKTKKTNNFKTGFSNARTNERRERTKANASLSLAQEEEHNAVSSSRIYFTRSLKQRIRPATAPQYEAASFL